jgi:hypothetical protein
VIDGKALSGCMNEQRGPTPSAKPGDGLESELIIALPRNLPRHEYGIRTNGIGFSLKVGWLKSPVRDRLAPGGKLHAGTCARAVG